MSCDCGQCRQHYRTLGIAFGIPEESAIEEAYREGVKQWHPDLYENYASLRADAEEHFKQIQIAFRELKEHNAIGAESTVESVAVQAKERPVESVAVERPGANIQPGASIPPKEETPTISVDAELVLSFGNARGCLVRSQFTEEVEEIIGLHLSKTDMALAIVDLNGARSRATYSHFLLLTSRGIMVRDLRNVISLLWFRDLGEINLIDKQKKGKSGFLHSLFEGISSDQPNCELQIYRNDGTLFYSISRQVDDSVKKVIYDFLRCKKSQSQPLARA